MNPSKKQYNFTLELKLDDYTKNLSYELEDFQGDLNRLIKEKRVAGKILQDHDPIEWADMVKNNVVRNVCYISVYTRKDLELLEEVIRHELNFRALRILPLIFRA